MCNNIYQKITQCKKGFSLVEALVTLSIFSMITLTFYSVFSSGTQQIIETKNRLGAISIANEKMEIARNLAYDTLGTKSWNGTSYDYGIPAGDILEDEDVSVNTRSFHIHTFVQYVDDDFDGLSPTDTIPNDYKRVKVEVSWGTGGSLQTVSLVSTFVPKGVETSIGGGVLAVHVIDSGGLGIPQATVHITNTAVTPSINVTTNTDSTGSLTLPAAPASTQGYKIEVSKSGYYSAMTYAPYPTTAFYPSDVHASVVEASFNQKTILFDLASGFVLATKDATGTDIPNIGFTLKGGRKLGDDAGLNPIYTINTQNYNSGSSSQQTFSNESPGPYEITFPALSSQYRFLRLSTQEDIKEIFNILPGETKNIDIVFADTQVQSVLFTVTDQATGDSLQNASVHLIESISGYDATVNTDRYGQAYFPETLPALVDGTYDYTISATGYSDSTGSISVSGGNLQEKSITLTAL